MSKRKGMIAVLCGIAQEHGTPFFAYHLDQVADRITALEKAFGGRFSISYAMKGNPNPKLLRWLQSRIGQLDVSSRGELERAVETGWAPERISFTGPVKRDVDLAAAVDRGIGEIVLESVAEAERLDRVLAERRRRQRVLVRIGPRRMPRGFGVHMAGRPSQFGIDEEDLWSSFEHLRRLDRLEIVGLHSYSGTQCLKAAAVAENYRILAELFSQTCDLYRIVPLKLVFGSGLGIPYYDGDLPIDLDDVAEGSKVALDRLQSRFPTSELVLETSRYLVGEAGLYVVQIVGKKTSRGVEICLCDGGMNHHLGACGHLGSVIHRNYRMFKVAPRSSGEQEGVYDLVGPLCTSIDRLGHRVKLPLLEVGDLVAIESSGAYGLTASPIHFISHDPPKELLVETCNGQLSVTDATQFHGASRSQLRS